MIITIDGPAGTGKSSVSKTVAERLGFDFLDTGAMYRAVALAAVRQNADLSNEIALASIATQCGVEFDWTRKPPDVLLNGQIVSDLIRSAPVTSAASQIAVFPAIRAQLVAQQQRIGRSRPNLVTEGRDQGSVVFPDAQLKFYLDATPQERARRRVAQLHARGEAADHQEILSQILTRDHRDSTRSTGPLSVPKGAEVIDTTPLTEQQVVNLIIARAVALRGQP